MIFTRIFLIAGLLTASGCSAIISKAGIDPYSFKTREEVHRWFGSPKSGTTPEGQVCEDYVTRWKFSEDNNWGMGIAMTMGLGEFVAFPVEVYCLVHYTVTGRNVRFVYDAAGKVMNVTFESKASCLQTPRDSGDN